MSNYCFLLSNTVLFVFLTGCPKKSDTTTANESQSVDETPPSKESMSEEVSQDPPQKATIMLSQYDTLAECAIEDSSSKEAESASEEQAQQIFTENQNNIQKCYDQQDTEVINSVELTFSIVEGKVESVQFIDSEFANSALATCIQDTILTWTYFNNCTDTGKLTISSK